MRYMVDARTVVLLALLACVSILLAAGSALYGLHARHVVHDAQKVVARADSLVNDWIARGCAPRTKALP